MLHLDTLDITLKFPQIIFNQDSSYTCSIFFGCPVGFIMGITVYFTSLFYELHGTLAGQGTETTQSG